jgi:hypothetical protein
MDAAYHASMMADSEINNTCFTDSALSAEQQEVVHMQSNYRSSSLMNYKNPNGTVTETGLSLEQRAAARTGAETDEDALAEQTLRWIPRLPAEGSVSKARLEVRTRS